ncbi:hypothetical protein B0H13DRAFT_1747328 [Mycena leptocephala]|nr:hypothetical protein B0H13DRAFT_1747328 [Mycena leptocephala]
MIGESHLRHRNEDISVPFYCTVATPNTPQNWNYTTMPQVGLNGRTVAFPCGFALGKILRRRVPRCLEVSRGTSRTARHISAKVGPEPVKMQWSLFKISTAGSPILFITLPTCFLRPLSCCTRVTLPTLKNLGILPLHDLPSVGQLTSLQIAAIPVVAFLPFLCFS